MPFIAKKQYYRIILAGTFALLTCLMIFSSTMGVAKISFFESIKIIISRIPVLGRYIYTGSIDSTHYTIVLDIRLPRIVVSALVGTGLSVVGGTFQGMFKNPMADPYVLGISSGAALGATAAIILGMESSFAGLGVVTLAAFAGALLTALLVYNIARVGNRVPTITLLLAGIAVSFLFSSIISAIMIFHRDQVEKIIYWTMGSVSTATWKKAGILFPVVTAGSLMLISYSRELNVMSTGEETARSLGVDVEKVKKLLLAVSSIVVAACVSMSGIIGFVGLIIPHMVRMLTGSDHRNLLPFSAAAGAIFMVAADTLARTAIPPSELPVGVITSLFGAPYFIYLLSRNKKKVA